MNSLESLDNFTFGTSPSHKKCSRCGNVVEPMITYVPADSGYTLLLSVCQLVLILILAIKTW